MSSAKITSGRKQSFSMTKVHRIKLLCLCCGAKVVIAYTKLTFSANLSVSQCLSLKSRGLFLSGTKSQFCSMIAFKMYIFVKS